jgi:1-deoxy-D-xylulose-5-phosphate reductoisomerase
MKKKIAILGSTGSIGANTLKIIKRDKKGFKVNLLTTNKNVNKIIKQAKEFKVKNIIISNLNCYRKAKIEYRKLNIKIFNNFDHLDQIIGTKNDIIMSSITGLNGFLPTLKSIKHTKKILIANKESIICGWNLINKELKKYKTDFVPVDSEHFSIWSLLKNHSSNDVEKILITASGGPFLKLPKKYFSNISVKKALRHPNWKMGKKITIDSATLMNKVFEVIEAKKIFNIDYKDISILTHPKSYVHAIIKFKNGIIKFLAHDSDMKIPIHNSIYFPKEKKFKSKIIDFEILNNLNFNKVDTTKFFLVKLLGNMPQHTSLFETALITINDHFVHMFLENKISFTNLMYLINKISNLKDIQKLKKISPKNYNDIFSCKNIVSLKLKKLRI